MSQISIPELPQSMIKKLSSLKVALFLWKQEWRTMPLNLQTYFNTWNLGFCILIQSYYEPSSRIGMDFMKVASFAIHCAHLPPTGAG